MTKYCVFGDVHLDATTDSDPSYNLFQQIVKKEKFDGAICLGDWLDFSYISQWVEGMPGLVEGKRLKEDFVLLEDELKFFKKYCKEVVYLSGNHEDRVIKYVQKNPVLEGILSIEEICREQKVQFIPTNKQPHRFLSDFFITHGLSINKYFASQLVQNSGSSIVQGHAHRTQSFSYRYPDGRVITGFGLGTLGPLNPDYVQGMRITGWTQSFGILSVEGQHWQFDTIPVTNGKCIVGGKLYSISPLPTQVS